MTGLQQTYLSLYGGHMWSGRKKNDWDFLQQQQKKEKKELMKTNVKIKTKK